MSTVVVMPGGFHPFHAGHFALYQSAKKAFPNADVYVAATNDTSERPFPFSLKEKLAKLAGIEPGKFIQVKSPFQVREITDHYDPEKDVLIFVRSEKDRNESPKPGGMKKDGTPSYFQPWTGKDVQPFGKHAYFEYLPTVEFGPGITSATQIRKAWPTLNDKRKLAMVMSLYPATQKNSKLAQTVVGMFDQVMGEELEEARANTAGARAGLSKRKETKPLSAEEQAAKDKAKADKWLEKERAKMAAKKGVAEDDVWGPQGNFAGDKPVELGNATLKQIQVGDIVMYIDQKAKVLAMSKDRKYSRINIQTGMGGITKDVLTSDLKQLGQGVVNEFAIDKPDDGDESRKFIPWNEFVDQLKQILHKDFDCKESINMNVIKAKFVPYDPMEYGPTMIYSYFERRAGRKGANGVRGQIQVGNFFKGSKPGDNQLMTGFHLLKGTEFERYFDLTFDNLYKIARIIQGNTQGRLESQQGVAEGEAGNYYSIALQMYPHLKQFDRATVITALNNAYEDYLMHYGYEGIGPDEERSMINRAIKGLEKGVAEAGSEEINEGSQIERKIARVQSMIQDYYNRAKATKNDIKKNHYIQMADQLQSELDRLINDSNEMERDGNMVAQHDDEPSNTWNRGGLAEDYLDEK